MHLADAFIQSDLHWLTHSSDSFYILSALAFPGNRTHDLGVANAMLYQLSYRKDIYICLLFWVVLAIKENLPQCWLANYDTLPFLNRWPEWFLMSGWLIGYWLIFAMVFWVIASYIIWWLLMGPSPPPSLYMMVTRYDASSSCNISMWPLN